MAQVKAANGITITAGKASRTLTIKMNGKSAESLDPDRGVSGHKPLAAYW
ncbi:MAG: hypothetical protein ACOYNZ_13915 [Rhodoferax sp.]